MLLKTYLTAIVHDDVIHSRRAASVDAITHGRRAHSHSVKINCFYHDCKQMLFRLTVQRLSGQEMAVHTRVGDIWTRF